MSTKPLSLKILDAASIALLVVASILVFFFTSVDVTTGYVQKIFYFHVSAAWVGMLSFILAAVVGGVYLVTRAHKWDVISLAGVEVGMVFTLITIVTGSIWARPTWNTWWQWDPRLTSITIMELAYAAYLMLRAGIEDPERRARFGAVYAIVAVLTVPLTFFSIRLLRTIHPVIIGSSSPTAEGGFDLSPDMVRTFLFSLLTFTVIFVDILWHRVRLGFLADKVEELRIKLSE